MQLSVVILNYNVRYFLELCLQSVMAATENIDAEIIVVDNASPDDSIAVVKQRFPQVRLIENQENQGFPKGNNIGVGHAKGEYICILNPDTVVAEDTFVKLLRFVDEAKDMGIVGVKLIDGTGSFLPESKRGLPTPWVSFTRFLGLYKISKRLFGKYYALHLDKDEISEVDILVGAFMFMKKSVYQEVGGFDECYFMFGEDIDLSYTVQQKGYKNYYFPQVTTIHYKGESTAKDQEYLRRFKEGMDLFYDKYFSRNVFFDLFMKIGIGQFAKRKLRHNISPRELPEQVIYLGDDPQHVKQLGQLLRAPVDHLSDFDALVVSKSTGLVVVDAEAFTFQTIVEGMQKLANKGFTYRIWPKGCNFILGSDASNSRGEVIFLK